MPKEVTNEDLALAIADGFAGVDKRFEQVDKRFEQVDKRFEQVEKRLDGVENRLGSVERKLDKVIENDVDRHEREIKFLANKVGVELSR